MIFPFRRTGTGRLWPGLRAIGSLYSIECRTRCAKASGEKSDKNPDSGKVTEGVREYVPTPTGGKNDHFHSDSEDL